MLQCYFSHHLIATIYEGKMFQSKLASNLANVKRKKKTLYLTDRCIKKKQSIYLYRKKINFPQQFCENEINKCFT